jgi:mono/diheme cytochrome c family protein
MDNRGASVEIAVMKPVLIALSALLAGAAATFVVAPAAAQEIGDPLEGRAYAAGVCAACHAVMPGEATSPRPEATPFETVANTAGMTANALAAWLQSSHPTMPDIKLSDADMRNVIEYILSLKKE